MATRSQGSLVKHCNKCAQDTKHIIRCQYAVEETDDIRVFGVAGEHDPVQDTVASVYYIASCRGCEHTSFQLVSQSDLWTDQHGGPQTWVRQFPVVEGRREPRWMNGWLILPLPMYDFVRSIYRAYWEGSYRLVAIGVRSLLEQIMVERVGEQGSLGKNISAFIEAGWVAGKAADIFRNKVVEVGNGAMHRAYTPNRVEIDTLLEIAENVVETVYVHPHEAKQLGIKMPPRSHRPAKPDA